MDTTTRWESFKAEGENFVDKLTDFVHEGNIRRLIVKHGDRTVAEFPLTVGVVGVVLAPVLAAIGALVALMKDCTIEIERSRTQDSQTNPQVPVSVGPVDEQC